MHVRVETYSGYKADEYPRRFWIGDSAFDVVEVEDRWYSPGLSYYRIFAADAKRYILCQDLNDGQWSVRGL